MPNIKYIARVLTGVRWKKMNYILGVVKDKCGQSKVRTFFDILWCAARYGAGYYDYAMYGFYDLTGKQRDTYLTRVRNRKISDLMNDPAFHDDFDDKLRFNETFRRFLRRETLNGETATPRQMAEFAARSLSWTTWRSGRCLAVLPSVPAGPSPTSTRQRPRRRCSAISWCR